ncbi:MAG: imidazoleglycerol-phosphate dehydratase [Candidatus Verstraetearchaeota archaeon]|nr:imidazoleglycerol-phosphate dehydratase [Candidatus Verstraetearchaeota archaeon]
MEVERRTRETEVKAALQLVGGEVDVETGIPFLNHLVETLAKYAGIGLKLAAKQLKRVDDHHVAEDTALTLGEALRRALSERGAVKRFGYAIVPMDDSLALAAVDAGGRPYAVFEATFTRSEIGGLALENVKHFIESLAYSAGFTIHVKLLHGFNNHHKAEAVFKALGLALRQALQAEEEAMSLKGEVKWR